MWTIQWKDNEPHTVESSEHLNGVLDEFSCAQSNQRPILVQLRSPSGAVLMIGLGGDKNVLDQIAASGWSAQHSVGDAEAEGTIPYMMGSYESEMPKAYAIPTALARRAIDHCPGSIPGIHMQRNRVGSSAVERRYAKAEARVRFPAGASNLRSGNSVGRVPVFQTGDVGSTPAHCMNVAELQAVVAQKVEQSFCKRPIVGSTPARGSHSKSGV